MIAKITRGSGFRGALNYGFNEGKKAIEGKEAILIGGNMTGTTAKSLATEFKKCRQLRPDIKKPVWMEALRPVDGEELTRDQWNQLVTDHMKAIGLNPETHMHAIFQHPQDNHIHVIASRIGIDGNLYLGKNENLIASKDCRRIEKEYGLQQLPEKSDRPRKHLTKPEIDMKRLTGEVPPREKLQNIISKSLEGRPTQQEFEKRLTLSGVEFKLSSNGYSYKLDSIAFKGSQLGNDYKWNQLQKNIILPPEQARIARNAAWQAEQQRRSNYRANRYAIQSVGRFAARSLPQPLGLTIQITVELIAVIAKMNDWRQAHNYKKQVEQITTRMNDVRARVKAKSAQPAPAIISQVEPVVSPIVTEGNGQSEALRPVIKTNLPTQQPAVDVDSVSAVEAVRPVESKPVVELEKPLESKPVVVLQPVVEASKPVIVDSAPEYTLAERIVYHQIAAIDKKLENYIARTVAGKLDNEKSNELIGQSEIDLKNINFKNPQINPIPHIVTPYKNITVNGESIISIMDRVLAFESQIKESNPVQVEKSSQTTQAATAATKLKK